MVFAFGTLAGVVSAGPEGILNRLGSILMKSLAEELGAEVTPTDGNCLPLRSMMGAMPEQRTNSSAEGQRLRSEPRAAVSRAAWTAPAAGSAANRW